MDSPKISLTLTTEDGTTLESWTITKDDAGRTLVSSPRFNVDLARSPELFASAVAFAADSEFDRARQDEIDAAVDDILATDLRERQVLRNFLRNADGDRDHACRHGHFDCALRPGGVCFDESSSAALGVLVDRNYLTTEDYLTGDSIVEDAARSALEKIDAAAKSGDAPEDEDARLRRLYEARGAWEGGNARSVRGIER